MVTQLHDQCLSCDPRSVANPQVKVLKRGQLTAFLEAALQRAAEAAGQSAEAQAKMRDCEGRVRNLQSELQTAESRAMKAEQEAIRALSELEALRAELAQVTTERNQFRIDSITLGNQLRAIEGELATVDALKEAVANKDKNLKQKEQALQDVHQVLNDKGLQDVDKWLKQCEKQKILIDEYEYNEDFYHAFCQPNIEGLMRLLEDAANRAEALKKAISSMPQGVTQSVTGPAMAMVNAHLAIGTRARRQVAAYERSLAAMNEGKGTLERVVNLAVDIAQISMFIELVRMLNFGLQMAMLGLKKV